MPHNSNSHCSLACHTILSLGKARSKVILGLLLVLTPDPFTGIDLTGSLSSSPSLSNGRSFGSLVHVAEAASFLDSLPFSLFTRNVDHGRRQGGAATKVKEIISEEDVGPFVLDGIYSLAAKKKVVSKAGADTKEPTISVQGTSQSLGQWDLVGVSGVSAMHATLIPNTNKIVFLEKVERNSHAYLAEDSSKFSWSVEYDIEAATFRSLHTQSNMFCSAGGYRPDGTIVSLGGAEAQNDVVEGWNSLRFLSACTNGTGSGCDWDTRKDITLKDGRWYPTVEALADGRLFIFGGADRGASMNSEEIAVPTWELYPPLPSNPTRFPFLEETLPYNLYPMAHLMPDGNLFLFANKKAILFSTKTWSVIKNYPELPGPPRNYPLSGGSVLLPLRPENGYEPEVLICGGATDFSSRAKGQDQCGRIKPLAKNPEWVMEPMPLSRMMPDMTLLQDGSVLILNGANRGTAGYGRAKEPVLSPVRYQPWDEAGSNSRFAIQNPSYIPRLYHSIAMQVLDGRVMVAGSNPNANTLEWGEFSIEYRVEMFSPGYMFTTTPRPLLKADATLGRANVQPNADMTVAQLQAANQSPERGQGDGTTSENVISYDTVFEVEVEFFGGAWTESEVITPKTGSNGKIQVNLLNGGFVTHSTHMSQRLVGLEIVGYVAGPTDEALNRLKVKGPRDGALTPPGWYQMSVVENGIPSEGVWVRVM